MGFERIRFLRHLFGGTPGDRFGIDTTPSVQGLVELRSLLNSLHEHELSDVLLTDLAFAVIDTETTGFSPQDDVLLSIGAVVCDPEQTEGQAGFHCYVQIGKEREIPLVVSQLTGITKETLVGAPSLDQALQALLQYIGDRMIVAHHAAHDIRFLNAALRKTWGIELQSQVLDTGKLAMLMHAFKKYPSLDMLLALYEVPVNERHTALGDALMTAEVARRQLRLMADNQIRTLGQLWEKLLIFEHQQGHV